MNTELRTLTWHKYQQASAGWDGYLQDTRGNVHYWIATSGEVIPAEDIIGGDDDGQDENLSPFGNINWKDNPDG